MGVNGFDVLKKMSADNKKIMLATADNILRMSKVKAGTQITIGVSGDVLNQIYRGEMNCSFILFDSQQFKETKAELEAEK